ncbi:DUF5655 domain-containing protein [uncultured Martelella sp.]|uniref:DUF5655 domain-containing protein n=1 Tax=uncultured Martelella sp. TaxID=392331 RepID=UPI0029C7F657|nr:DUF5655 domain-containing protein [uncultured Martelella sp.]
MSDIKLFQFGGHDGVAELPGTALQIEKSLQVLFEANLEILLGVRFLASEHSTGPVHGGRIDTLGLDEDNSPVIIEYKRSINENVINQGLFYLDWLMDHRKEFQWLVMEQLGTEASKAVDWSAPRLLCIAGDFTRYDEHAVKQIPRNIELIRYRSFGPELLMLELVHVPKTNRSAMTKSAPVEKDIDEGDQANLGGAEYVQNGGDKGKYISQRMSYRLSQSPEGLRAIHDAAYEFLQSLGDDVQVKELLYYTAFKRLKNFVCMEIYPTTRNVHLFLKLNPDDVELVPGFVEDFRNTGHFGTGDVRVTLKSMADFERAQPLLQRAYDAG